MVWGWIDGGNSVALVKNKPEYRGHHRNLAAKQRHYWVSSFHASSSSSSSSSSSLYQVRSNFRISIHSLQRTDQIYIKSIHIFSVSFLRPDDLKYGHSGLGGASCLRSYASTHSTTSLPNHQHHQRHRFRRHFREQRGK